MNPERKPLWKTDAINMCGCKYKLYSAAFTQRERYSTENTENTENK